MLKALFFGSDEPTGSHHDRAMSPTPMAEEGLLTKERILDTEPGSTNSSSSSSIKVRRRVDVAIPAAAAAAAAAAMTAAADRDADTEPEDEDDGEDSVGAGGEALAKKGEKAPLVDTIIKELNDGDGSGLSALSPHRLLQAGKVVVLCCLYMCVGPSLILLNKHILKDLDDGRGFNYPMLLSCLGLISSSVTSHFLVRVVGFELPNQHKMNWQFYLKNVVPVGVCQALTLALGNAAYLYLTVSFIQMLKAFTPVVVLLIGVLFKIEAAEPKIVASVLGICAGTAVASYGEINFSLIGILTMFAAEVTEAVRLVLVQYLLQNLRFGLIESQYYLAPCAAVALFSASMLLELPSIRRNNAWEQMAAHPMLFFFAGTLGVGVHFLSFLVVQTTNSVTLKVLGTARNALLVLASVYIFGELVSGTQFMGYSLSLAFFTYYSYLKTRKI